MDHGLISIIDLVIEIFYFLPENISVTIIKTFVATKIVFNCHRSVATKSCFNSNLPHGLGWLNDKIFSSQ
jgi:hypothetical protein